MNHRRARGVNPPLAIVVSYGTMGLVPSSCWSVVTLDLEDVSIRPSGPDVALRLAKESESGTLGACGEVGDCVELQFDGAHGMVLYMSADRKVFRPHFPHRQESGDGIEEFFCAFCGVQLGDRAEMLRSCMAREEAIRLCREILWGRLPDTIPGASSDQPCLPGMEAFTEEQAQWGMVEWCPLRPRRSSPPAERGDSVCPGCAR